MAKLNSYPLFVGIITCISTGFGIVSGLLDSQSNLVLAMIALSLLFFLCFFMMNEIGHPNPNTPIDNRCETVAFLLMLAQYITLLFAIMILGVVRDKPASSTIRVSLVIDTLLMIAMFLFFARRDKDTLLFCLV